MLAETLEGFMVEIFGVPNTWESCSYIIFQKGYTVSINYEETEDYFRSTCMAEKDSHQFIADQFLPLLGLISIYENLEGDLNEMRREGHELSRKIPENYQELYFDDDDDD
jgi:hypothetical protein